ncbi:MAG: histidine kinase, partial [Propionibacteriaceae bacterium]|nr:histidine kinase [Propionibacteriaceae bacterium]
AVLLSQGFSRPALATATILAVAMSGLYVLAAWNAPKLHMPYPFQVALMVLDCSVAAVLLILGSVLLSLEPQLGFALVYLTLTLALHGQVAYPTRPYLFFAASMIAVSLIAFVVLRLPQHSDQLFVMVVQALGGAALLLASTLSSISIRELLASTNAAWKQNLELSTSSARLDERLRLARDMHDTVTKNLYGARLLALSLDGPDAKENLEELQDSLTQTYEASRELLTTLRARKDFDEDVELVENLEQIIRRYPLDYEIDCPNALAKRLKPCQRELAQIFAELAENVHRHAEASRVDVRLASAFGRVQFSVRDDGKGMDISARRTGHFGLLGVGELAGELHGVMRIDSGAWGTEVRIVFPETRQGEVQ